MPLNKELLERIVKEDVDGLMDKNDSPHGYKDSWKRRGGIGAFMMLARKWDRLENSAKHFGWDIFKALIADRRPEGLIDDIRDLRRYLELVEHEFLENITTPGTIVPEAPTDIRNP